MSLFLVIGFCCRFLIRPLGRWDKKFYPFYYFPVSQLPEQYLQHKHQVENDYTVYDILVNSHTAKGALKVYSVGDRAGLFNILFDAMDAWFEEDEEIFVHPKDPYKVP